MGSRVPFAPSLLTLSLLITLHIYFIFFSWLFNFLYVTCVMVNKAVKKKKSSKITYVYIKVASRQYSTTFMLLLLSMMGVKLCRQVQVG